MNEMAKTTALCSAASALMMMERKRKSMTESPSRSFPSHFGAFFFCNVTQKQKSIFAVRTLVGKRFLFRST
jgi:hypothetical protein